MFFESCFLLHSCPAGSVADFYAQYLLRSFSLGRKQDSPDQSSADGDPSAALASRLPPGCCPPTAVSCVCAPTSHVQDHSSLAIPSLRVSRLGSGSGTGSACDKECCLEGQGGFLAAKKHTVPGFLSKRGVTPPSSFQRLKHVQKPQLLLPNDFPKHFQKLVILRYLR